MSLSPKERIKICRLCVHLSKAPKKFSKKFHLADKICLDCYPKIDNHPSWKLDRGLVNELMNEIDKIVQK